MCMHANADVCSHHTVTIYIHTCTREVFTPQGINGDFKSIPSGYISADVHEQLHTEMHNTCHILFKETFAVTYYI